MTKFLSFQGIVVEISDFFTGNEQENGCYKLISVQNLQGDLVNFVVSPTTYFVDQAQVSIGDLVIGYYDALAPVPLIFPPQYRAIVMVKNTPGQLVKVDYFNNQLLSSDATLQINIAPYTQVLLENGQLFDRYPANRNLIIIYGPTTASIPAQTTPYKIIVLCQ